MKRFWMVLFALVLALVFTACGESASSETESSAETTANAASAPDFSVLNEDGDTVHLSDFAGKPVILNFWATWCGPCQAELPDFEKKYQTYGDKIHFLMINLTNGSPDTVESAAEFVRTGGYTFPVYFDTESDDPLSTVSPFVIYDVSAIPVTVFINEAGEIVSSTTGMLNEETLQAGIDLLLPEN